jgi:hypothetical protein
MKATTFILTSLLFGILLVTGCQKPGPVELQDTSESEISEVQPISAPSDFSHDPDTTGLVAERYFGELVVAGIRYDAPGESHTMSLARGVFRDRTRPIVIGGRRVGYRTLDVGDLYIDGLPLYKLQRRVPRIPIDTLVGPFYALLNRDGVGGRGFRYFDNHRYGWTNADTNIIIDVNIVSAKDILVTRPIPQDIVRQRQNLLVEWIGGEEFVHLIVSVQLQGEPTQPILRMKLRSRLGRVVIPSNILQMLPADPSSRFVFSFISQTRSQAAMSGYPDTVLVHTASVHSLLLTVQP